MKYIAILFTASLFLSACGSASPESTPQLVNVYASSAAYPWLRGLYDCAGSAEALNITDPLSADISLRMGEPAILTSPAYQIGAEDLLVVIHGDSGLESLTLDQVQSLFSGRISNWKELAGRDLPVEVWTYSPETDIEGLFDQIIMKGEPISSLARLAVSVQSMADAITATQGSIGVLPRRQKPASVQEVYALSKLPILAITKSEPQGVLKNLLACEQEVK